MEEENTSGKRKIPTAVKGLIWVGLVLGVGYAAVYGYAWARLEKAQAVFRDAGRPISFDEYYARDLPREKNGALRYVEAEKILEEAEFEGEPFLEVLKRTVFLEKRGTAEQQKEALEKISVLVDTPEYKRAHAVMLEGALMGSGYFPDGKHWVPFLTYREVEWHLDSAILVISRAHLFPRETSHRSWESILIALDSNRAGVKGYITPWGDNLIYICERIVQNYAFVVPDQAMEKKLIQGLRKYEELELYLSSLDGKRLHFMEEWKNRKISSSQSDPFSPAPDDKILAVYKVLPPLRILDAVHYLDECALLLKEVQGFPAHPMKSSSNHYNVNPSAYYVISSQQGLMFLDSFDHIYGAMSIARQTRAYMEIHRFLRQNGRLPEDLAELQRSDLVDVLTGEAIPYRISETGFVLGAEGKELDCWWLSDSEDE